MKYQEPIRGRVTLSEKRDVRMFHMVALIYVHWMHLPFTRSEFGEALTERLGAAKGNSSHATLALHIARERYVLTLDNRRTYRLAEYGLAYLHTWTRPTGTEPDGLVSVEMFRNRLNLLRS